MKEESAFILEEGGKVFIEPYIEDLPELFVSYFKEILKVGDKIPRLEYYMSQGLCDSPLNFRVCGFSDVLCSFLSLAMLR